METSEKLLAVVRLVGHRINILHRRQWTRFRSTWSSSVAVLNGVVVVVPTLLICICFLADGAVSTAVIPAASVNSAAVICRGGGGGDSACSGTDLSGLRVANSLPIITTDDAGDVSDYSSPIGSSDKGDVMTSASVNGVPSIAKAGSSGQRRSPVPSGRSVRSAASHRHGGAIGSVGGVNRKHDEPVQFPITFRTSGAYFVTKLKLYATFRIYFQLKTTQADGLIMFSGSLDATKGQDFVAVEMFEGHLRYLFDVGSGVRVIQDRQSQPINDNRWHEVSIVRESIGQHVLRVDDSSSIDVLPDSRSVHYDLPADGSFFIGGLPSVSDIVGGLEASPSAPTGGGSSGAVSTSAAAAAAAAGIIIPGRSHPIVPVSVPRQVRSRGVGFQGCLGSINLNGDRWRLVDRREEIPIDMREKIVDGCDGPSTECTPTTCKNGGICIQQWNSYVCDCNSTSFTGLHCTDESIAYRFGQLGGLVTFSYPESERPDTRHDRLTMGFSTVQSDAILAVITSATAKDYIEVQLVDGAVFVVYNVGMSNHPVGELEHKVNDGHYHIMKFQRRGQNASLQLDDSAPYVKHPPGRQLTTFNHQGWVTVGGKKDSNGRLVRPFQGTIAGFAYNGLWILELAADSDMRVKIDGDVELDMNIHRSRDVSSVLSASSSPSKGSLSRPTDGPLPSPNSTPITPQCLLGDKKCSSDSKDRQVSDEGPLHTRVPNGKSDVVAIDPPESVVDPPESAVVDFLQRDNGSMGGRPCPVNDLHCRQAINQEPLSSFKPDRQLQNISSTGKHVTVLNTITSTTLLPVPTSVRRGTLPDTSSIAAVSTTSPSALPKPLITHLPAVALSGSSLRTSPADRQSSFQTSTIRNFPSAAVVVDNNNHTSSSNSSSRIKMSAVFPSPSTSPSVTSSSRSSSGTAAGRVSVVSATGIASPWLTNTVIAGAAGGAVAMTVLIGLVAFAVCRYRSREQGTYNLDAATSINGYAYEPCDTTITVGVPTPSTGVGPASATVSNGSSPPLLPPPPPSVLNGGSGGVARGRTLGRRRSKSIGNGGGSSTTSSIVSGAAANGIGASGSLGRRTAPRTKKVVREWYV